MEQIYIEKSLCTPTGKGLDSRPSAQAKRFDSSHRHISNRYSNFSYFDLYSNRGGFDSFPFLMVRLGVGKLTLLRIYNIMLL